MKFIRKTLKILFSLVLFLALVYFVGPTPTHTEISKSIVPLGIDPVTLDSYLHEKEAGQPFIKQDNEARIVWFDSSGVKTEYAVVYLHGFSASQGEGYPVHLEFANRYGCNLYLPRLPGHGRADSLAMKGLTAEDLVEGAKEAIAIGRLIGDKVIVMSTSTGGTLALYLASGNDVHSLILYSPNIAIKDGGAKALTGPWGRQLGEYLLGGEFVNWGAASGPDSLYWNRLYHIDGLIAMQDLIDQSMKESTFKEIRFPTFLGYYYKNEQEQDMTVSVDRMQWMYELLGTPDSMKMERAFTAVGAHVIAGEYKSKDIKAVQKATYQFAEEILKLKQK